MEKVFEINVDVKSDKVIILEKTSSRTFVINLDKLKSMNVYGFKKVNIKDVVTLKLKKYDFAFQMCPTKMELSFDVSNGKKTEVYVLYANETFEMADLSEKLSEITDIEMLKLIITSLKNQVQNYESRIKDYESRLYDYENSGYGSY